MPYRSNNFTTSHSFNMTDMEEKVKKAKNDKKIFMVTGGYEPLRQSLLVRGWIEKIPDDKLSLIPPTSERFILALLLKNSPFHFIWQPRSRPIKNLHNLSPFINSINRQRNFDFTTKDGITNCANNFQWYHIDGLTNLSYQRAHILIDKSAKEEFSEDFRRSAFTSFIKFLNDSGNDFRLLFTSSDDGITTDCINFTVQKIELIIKMENHEDIDTSLLFDVCAKFPKNQKESLRDIRQIINGTSKFKFQTDFLMEMCRAKVQHCAEKIANQWPHLLYDGHKNVWIMKPIGSSSGYGVTVVNSEETIWEMVQSSAMKYIVQKYVEEPILIHNRKFDMRIYFITFIRNGFVDVWLYKDCYVKFGTHSFNLDNLHRSVHVTNYAVQKYFMTNTQQVPEARENMWTLAQLKSYFESIDKANIWRDQIYPGIKKNLLGVILASLDSTELSENNFELNGADFMIGFDFQPILIEVNSVPALFFSRTVVELITNKLLEDVVKVVVDKQSDPAAPTGDFELIHTFEIPAVSNVDLTITGTRIEGQSARIQGSSRPASKKSKIDVKMNTNTLLMYREGNQAQPIYLRENISGELNV